MRKHYEKELFMSSTLMEIEAQAAKLTPEERAKLVEFLLLSLEETDQAEIETAWEDEIGRRIAKYERGESVLIDGDEVFREAYALVETTEST